MINTLSGLKTHFPNVIIEDLFFDNTPKHNGALQSIALNNLIEIQQNPYSCLENLVINDLALLAHEFQKFPQCLIITPCQDIQKLKRLQQLVPQLEFALGYTLNLSTNEKNVDLYTQDTLIKKLQMELKFNRPAFIGIIDPFIIDPQNQIWNNIIQSYIYCSKQYNIPIIIDYQNKKSDFSFPQDVNLIVMNPYAEIQINNSLFQSTTQVISLTPNMGLIVLSNNLYDKKLFDSPQFLFTSNVKFKSQLKEFGGRGFSSYANQGLLKLLQWAEEIQIVEEIKIWQCPICKGEFNDATIEKFKKMGQEFCSMKCLRIGLQ